MNLLIVGNDAAFLECQSRLGNAHLYQRVDSMVDDQEALSQADVVFDFSEVHSPLAVDYYVQQSKTVVFLNTVFTTRAAVLAGKSSQMPIVGFCGLPTFFDRDVLEVCGVGQRQNQVDAMMQALAWQYVAVKDQVGFVTPRVVCMIINEAFETWRDGVASKEDIDLSMKLGTNYPFGPFAWAERIGIDNVRKLLMTLEKETGDGRYKVMF